MPRTSDARIRMIQSAALLQRERGVQGTSFADVLAHSGAPRGSTYHHFPGGRAQLAEEATRYAADVIEEQLTAVLASTDPASALSAFVAVWLEVLRSSDFAAGCPVAAGAVDSDPSSAARVAAGEGFARWQAKLGEALIHAGADPARAPAVATFAISAVEGALILARAQQSVEPLEHVAALLEELLPQQLDSDGSGD